MTTQLLRVLEPVRKLFGPQDIANGEPPPAPAGASSVSPGIAERRAPLLVFWIAQRKIWLLYEAPYSIGSSMCIAPLSWATSCKNTPASVGTGRFHSESRSHVKTSLELPIQAHATQDPSAQCGPLEAGAATES